MTPDEFKARLRRMGIDPDKGGWRKTREVSPQDLPAVGKQIEMLQSLKKMIEQQVSKDIETVDDLKLKLQKMKHGGSYE